MVECVKRKRLRVGKLIRCIMDLVNLLLQVQEYLTKHPASRIQDRAGCFALKPEMMADSQSAKLWRCIKHAEQFFPGDPICCCIVLFDRYAEAEAF